MWEKKGEKVVSHKCRNVFLEILQMFAKFFGKFMKIKCVFAIDEKAVRL